MVQYKGLNLHGCSFSWSFRHQTLTEPVSQELGWVLEDGHGQRGPATALPGGAHGCRRADMTHRMVGQQVQWSGEQEKGRRSADEIKNASWDQILKGFKGHREEFRFFFPTGHGGRRVGVELETDPKLGRNMVRCAFQSKHWQPCRQMVGWRDSGAQ